MLEPYEWKHSRTVLRRERMSNRPDLVDYVAGPLFDQAGILTAEIDLNQIIQSKFDWDPVGHYNRPEIFKLEINENK